MPPELVNSVIVPAIAGLTTVILRAGIPKKEAGVVAVAIGIVLECLAAYYTGPNPNYANAAFIGIGVGLAADGLPGASQRVIQYGKAGKAQAIAAGAAVKLAVANRPRVNMSVQRPSSAPAVRIPAQTQSES